MKSFKRPFSLLIIVMLLVQALGMTALADIGGTIVYVGDWDTNTTDGGVEIVCTLYDVNSGELALAADVALADAYALITDSDTGEVYDAFDLTGPVTAYLLTEKGNYTVTAHSRAFDGEELGYFGMSDYGYTYFTQSLRVNDFQFPAAALTREDVLRIYYENGFALQADFAESAGKVTVTLSPLNPADNLATLIAGRAPFVVFSDLANGSEEILHFDASGKMTVNVGSSAEYMLIVLDEISAAVYYSEEINDCIIPAVYPYDASGSTAPDPVHFTDVPDDAWYAEYVYFAAAAGLINGTGDGTTYSPNNNMSYAEAITLAVRLQGVFCTEISLFPTDGAWYEPYVNYAKEHGIPWQFANYNAPITREEYVGIFHAALVSCGAIDFLYPLNTVEDGVIPDVSMSSQYADAIYTFYRAGVLTGSDAAGTFNPKSNILRSEVATVLCRIVEPAFCKTLNLSK